MLQPRAEELPQGKADILIGIDLGGTNLKTIAVDRERRILAKRSVPTRALLGPERVIEDILEEANNVLHAAHGKWSDVLTIGVGAPGLLDWKTGFVHTLTNLPGWDNVPLGEMLCEGFNGVPSFIENDANAACFGEYWMGAGQGTKDMVLLTLGTGVGGGIVLGGQLLRGKDGTAGELGHVIVQRDGRMCYCGARGCLEPFGSVLGMIRTAVDWMGEVRETSLIDACRAEISNITGQMISECADQGDAFCDEVIRETGYWIGTGIVGIINTLNPEKVVLTGGMIAAGDRLLNAVRETALSQAFDVPAEGTEILYGTLGSDAGAIGAAALALSRLEG